MENKNHNKTKNFKKRKFFSRANSFCIRTLKQASNFFDKINKENTGNEKINNTDKIINTENTTDKEALTFFTSTRSKNFELLDTEKVVPAIYFENYNKNEEQDTKSADEEFESSDSSTIEYEDNFRLTRYDSTNTFKIPYTPENKRTKLNK